MAFKTTKSRVSSNEDLDNEEEDELAMIANRINKLMNKFIEGLRETPNEAEPEKEEKKDPRGHRCCECSGFGQLNVKILRRLRGRPIMQLLAMSLRKKKTRRIFTTLSIVTKN
jgi:hypothetical protein